MGPETEFRIQNTVTHVHKTTYEPLIDTALYVNAFDVGKSITWANGRGLGPGNLDFFGPQMVLAYWLDAISQAQKSLDFQDPTPSHLPSNWICLHQKNYVLGYINHRSINSYIGTDV